MFPPDSNTTSKILTIWSPLAYLHFSYPPNFSKIGLEQSGLLCPLTTKTLFKKIITWFDLVAG